MHEVKPSSFCQPRITPPQTFPGESCLVIFWVEKNKPKNKKWKQKTTNPPPILGLSSIVYMVMRKVAYFYSLKSNHLTGEIWFLIHPVIEFGIAREYNARLEDEGEGEVSYCSSLHQQMIENSKEIQIMKYPSEIF